MKRTHPGLFFKKASPQKQTTRNKVQPTKAVPHRAKNANRRRQGS